MATRPNHLVYIDDSQPGISRKGAGRGWAYYDPHGTLITDRAEKQRLNAIALPPAYRDAWFSPLPQGHILATGWDDRGRKQYRYHPEFRIWRESEKFDGCLTFGELLPRLRKQVEQDMRHPRLGKSRAVASVVRLLDLGAIRVGNTSYARTNRSFGATTLRRRHAEVTGQTLRLSFTAKGGKQREVELSDASLARCVRRMQDLPGQHLFRWLDGEGEAHDVSSTDVNEYLAEVMGGPFTAKNFRTWHASVMAYRLLGEADDVLTLKAVLERVAEYLGNTPAVTRKSYVHPAVIDLVGKQQEWRSELRLPRRTQYANRWERGLLELLEQSPSAEKLLAAAAA